MVPVTTANPLPTTGSGGGGGGGAVTIANGADVTQGTIGDTQATGTVVGYLKSLYADFFGTPQAIKVDGSGAVQPVSQSGTWTVGLSSGSSVIGHVVTDTGSTTAVTQPTASNLNATVVNAAGSAVIGKVGIDQTTVGTTNAVSLAQIGSTTASTGNGTTGAGSLRVTLSSDNNAIALAGQGVLATTAPSNATQTGVRAQTTNPTAVTSGQMVSPTADKTGKLVTVDAIRTLKLSQKTTLSNTTAETTVVTAGTSGVFNDVFSVILANTGATSTKVDLRDSTAGAVIATLYVPAGETRGFTLPAGSGYTQTTAANNWTAQCGSATTAMEVSVIYIQNI